MPRNRDPRFPADPLERAFDLGWMLHLYDVRTRAALSRKRCGPEPGRKRTARGKSTAPLATRAPVPETPPGASRRPPDTSSGLVNAEGNGALEPGSKEAKRIINPLPAREFIR